MKVYIVQYIRLFVMTSHFFQTRLQTIQEVSEDEEVDALNRACEDPKHVRATSVVLAFDEKTQKAICGACASRASKTKKPRMT